MLIKSKLLIGYTLLLCLTGFLLFYNLSSNSIIIWDEAIYANNAVEMTMSGNPLVIMNDGIPTFYNTKPPLVIWLQSLSIHCFGINEFAIRLPSAISALITVIALLFFSSKVLKMPVVGIIGVCTLLLSDGYLRYHVTRTGDLDATLCMFTTIFTLTYYMALIADNDKERKKSILLTGIGVTLAYFSKSFAGLLPLLGMFIFTILNSQRNKIFGDKRLYTVFFMSLFLILGYYIFRESYAEGYIEKVYFSEVKRLFSNIMPWHNHPFDFYFDNWLSRKFFYPFVYFFLLSPLALFWIKEKNIRFFSFYIFLWIFSYFLLISIPIVKLEWYDAPLYPFLSLLVGVFIYSLYQEIIKESKLLSVVYIICICIIYFFPLKNSINKIIYDIKPTQEQEFPGHFMRQLDKELPKIKNYIVLHQVRWIEHLDQIKFYKKSYEIEKGANIKVSQLMSEVSVSDTILTCQQNKMDSIINNFSYQLISKNDKCFLIFLEKPKS